MHNYPMESYMKRWLLFMALSALLVPRSFFAQASVSGKVILGSTKQPVKADWVTLIKSGQGLQTLQQLDNVSEYAFKDIPLNPMAPYLIRASYKGILYTQNVMINENKPYIADVSVAGVSDQWRDIDVRVPHMIVARTDDKLEIEQTFEITNNGANTFNPKDTNVPSFLFKLPDGVKLEAVTTSFDKSMPIPASVVNYKDKQGIIFPLRPGTTQIQITASAPYASPSLTWAQPMYYDVSEFRIFVTPKDIEVSGENFQHIHDEQLEANNFSITAATNLKSGSTIGISFKGGSARGGAPQEDDHPIDAAANEIQRNVFFLAPLLMSFLLFALYIALNRKHQSDGGGAQQKAHWMAEQEKLIASIARLDDEYAENSDNSEYVDRRRDLKHQLRDVSKRIQRAGA